MFWKRIDAGLDRVGLVRPRRHDGAAGGAAARRRRAAVRRRRAAGRRRRRSADAADAATGALGLRRRRPRRRRRRHRRNNALRLRPVAPVGHAPSGASILPVFFTEFGLIFRRISLRRQVVALESPTARTVLDAEDVTASVDWHQLYTKLRWQVATLSLQLFTPAQQQRYLVGFFFMNGFGQILLGFSLSRIWFPLDFL